MSTKLQLHLNNDLVDSSPQSYSVAYSKAAGSNTAIFSSNAWVSQYPSNYGSLDIANFSIGKQFTIQFFAQLFNTKSSSNFFKLGSEITCYRSGVNIVVDLTISGYPTLTATFDTTGIDLTAMHFYTFAKIEGVITLYIDGVVVGYHDYYVESNENAGLASWVPATATLKFGDTSDHSGFDGVMDEITVNDYTVATTGIYNFASGSLADSSGNGFDFTHTGYASEIKSGGWVNILPANTYDVSSGSPTNTFGGSDFTLDFFLRSFPGHFAADNNTYNWNDTTFLSTGTGLSSDRTSELRIFGSNTNQLNVAMGGNVIVSASVPINWVNGTSGARAFQVSITRVAGKVRIYIDGYCLATGSVSNFAFNLTNKLYLGASSQKSPIVDIRGIRFAHTCFYTGATFTRSASNTNWSTVSSFTGPSTTPTVVSNPTYDTIDTAPILPTDFALTQANDGVELSWTASTGTAPILYSVVRSTSSDLSGATTLSSSVSSTSFKDTTGSVGTTYYYGVSASNSVGSTSSIASTSILYNLGGSMSNQIIKKFLGADSVDSTKIKLLKDTALRFTKQNSSEAELKLDANDRLVLGSDLIVINSDLSAYMKADGSTTQSGAINMNSHKITNLTDPSVGSQDAASAAYVDANGGFVAGTADGTDVTLSATGRKIAFTSGSVATKVFPPALASMVVGEICIVINMASADITVRLPDDSDLVGVVPSGHFAYITLTSKTGSGAFGFHALMYRGSTSYNAASRKIINLTAGSSAADAVRYDQVLLLAGGTMSGAIAMGSNKITGLANGVDSGDAVNLSQLQAQVSDTAYNSSSWNAVTDVAPSKNAVRDEMENRAKKDLSNLASVAINVDLMPASSGTISLGDASLPFKNITLSDSIKDISGVSAFNIPNRTLTNSLIGQSQLIVDFSGPSLQLNSRKISQVADPSNAQDVATKAYVDNKVAGLSWKQAAHVASVANVNISSAPSSIDNHSLEADQRILLKDQSTASENGIYVFSSAGSALTRADDANTWSEIVGAVVYVEMGDTNAGSKWVNTNIAGGTLGSTSISFTLFAATNVLDGAGSNGAVAYWTSAHTLSYEAQLSASRGGLGSDASAFSGVLKASSGVFSASSIVNADVSSSAAIAYSKLDLASSIVNADISSSAAIAYSKLSLSGSIVNADISASAAIAYTKLSLTGSIVNADIKSSAAIAFSKMEALTANQIPSINSSGVIVASGLPSSYFSTISSNVQDQLDAKLPKAGGTMSGAIAMGSNKITGLADPSAASQDAATAAYVDAMGGLLGGQNANGTKVTLTASQKKVSFSSGSTATSVVLPPLADLVVGSQVNLVNVSSGSITLRNSGDTADVGVILPGHMGTASLASKSGAGTWGFSQSLLRTSSGYNAGSAKITGLAAGTTSGDAVRYEQAILASGANPFAANQAMGGYKLTGLAAGSANGDSVRYEQVLLLTGGTMSAPINMGTTNKITNLAAGSAAGDAVRWEQLFTFQKKKITLSSTNISNQYIDLDYAAVSNSIQVFVGRLAVHESLDSGVTDDYTISVSGGVTRLTFQNSLATGGAEALVSGDVLYITYAKLNG